MIGDVNMKRFLFLTIVLSLFVVKVFPTVTHVTLTYYQPVKAQCDSEPLVTADGSRISLYHLKHNRIKWCAVSRDLLWLFPKNKPKRIHIEGYGTYEVRDVMHKRYSHCVDILIHPKDSRKIKQEKVKIKILK